MTQAVVMYDAKEANRETAVIKAALKKAAGAVDAVKSRLVEAEAHEIWRPLGYRSMGAYVAGEFGMSRSNAYRTLDTARASLLLEAKTVPLRDSSPPVVSQREAARLTAPLKQKRAHRGPPSLTTWLQDFRNDVERMETALENAGDDALAYLPAQERHDLERTADRCFTFWGELRDRLAAPVERRYVEDGA